MTRRQLYARIVTDHPGITSQELWTRAFDSNEYGAHGVSPNAPWPMLNEMCRQGQVRKGAKIGVAVTWWPVTDAASPTQ